MALGIFLVMLAIIGVFLGVIRRSRLLLVGSMIGLLVVISAWTYFYNNPY